MRRQPDAHRGVRLVGSGRHQKPVAEIILAVKVVSVCIQPTSVFQNHGAHHGHSLTVPLPCHGINVRIQRIAYLQILFKRFLSGFAVQPRLSAVVTVRAHNAVPRAEFRHPAGIKLVGRRLHKSSQVVRSRPVSHKSGVDAETYLISEFIGRIVDISRPRGSKMLPCVTASRDKHRARFDGIFLPRFVRAFRCEYGRRIGAQHVKFIGPEPVAVASGDDAVHIRPDPFAVVEIKRFAAVCLGRSGVVVQSHAEAQLVCFFKHRVYIGKFGQIVVPHLFAPFFSRSGLIAAVVRHVASPAVVENIAVGRIPLVAQTMQPFRKFFLSGVVVAVFGQHKPVRPFAVKLHSAGDFGILVENGLKIRTVHKKVIEVALSFESAAALKKHGVFLDGVEKNPVPDGTHEKGRYQPTVRHGKLIEVLVVTVEVVASAVIARPEPEYSARARRRFGFAYAHGVSVRVHSLLVAVLADEIAAKVVHSYTHRRKIYPHFHTVGKYTHAVGALRNGVFHRRPIVFLHHIILRIVRSVSVRTAER